MTNSLPKKAICCAHQPVVFEDFFELGQRETESPFLTPSSRKWAANLTLKSSFAAAIFLLLAFGTSFYEKTLSLSHLLLLPVYFLAGIPSLIEAIEDLLNFEVNIDILMTLAAFSSVLIGSGMEGALLLVLFALSGSMEDAVTTKAKNAISSLHKLSPTKGYVIDEVGNLAERSVKDISLGSKILVKSGQVVPLDGIVLEGISSVNLVHLTGENLPVTKKKGDLVPAGARNLEGSLTLHVTHTSSDSTLAKIIQLVTQAQESRPKLQRLFNRFSRTYALTIISLSALFALTLPLVISMPYFGFEGSIYRALAFLIAASPCALIIAIPIAYLSAISACARKGVLLKGGMVLDALASCKAIALDKTGTLTTGELKCQSLEMLENKSHYSLKQALSVAYALEMNAVHPIAKAILDEAQNKKLKPAALKDFKAIAGQGLEAIALMNSAEVYVAIGHVEFIAQKLPFIKAEKLLSRIKVIQEQGELVAVLLIGEDLFLLRFADMVRPKVKKTLDSLQNHSKMSLVMLTGDHEQSARSIATELGIKEYHANLRPEDKLNYITQLSRNRGLVMVGDGINDAPALARATVGICMGKSGSTPALDAAEIVLLNDNIELLDWLLQKAHQTQRIVKQNLILAASAILVASLPALAGFIPLWIAVVMHEGGTVLVGLNALRLLRG